MAGRSGKRTPNSAAASGGAGFEFSFTPAAAGPLIAPRFVNPHRLVIPLYVLAMALLALGAGAWFVDARAEYRQLKQTEAAIRLKLAAAEQRLLEQERILQRLRNDPGFVESAIRRRLSQAKPGEVVFRFED